MPSDTFTFEEATAPDTFSFEEASDTPSLQPALSASEMAVRPPAGFVPASDPYGVALSNELVPPPDILRQAGEKMEQEYQRPLVNIPSEPFKAISGPVAQIFGQPAAEQFEKRLAGGLSSMTSKEGLATIPYFLVPGLGRLLGIGYGTQQVASGAGSISGGDVGGGLADLLMGGALLKGSEHSRVPSEPVLSDSIKAVAVRSPEGEILTGPLGTRHNEIARAADIPEPPEKDRGFVIQTPEGEKTVLGTEGRKEALPIAEEAGQVKPDEELTPKLKDLKDEGELHGAMTKESEKPLTPEKIQSLRTPSEGEVPEGFEPKPFAYSRETPEEVQEKHSLYSKDAPEGLTLDLYKNTPAGELKSATRKLSDGKVAGTVAVEWAAINDVRKASDQISKVKEWAKESYKSQDLKESEKQYDAMPSGKERDELLQKVFDVQAKTPLIHEGIEAVANYGKEFGISQEAVNAARKASAGYRLKKPFEEVFPEPAKEVTPLEKEKIQSIPEPSIGETGRTRSSILKTAIEDFPFGKRAVVEGTKDLRSSDVMAALEFANVPIADRIGIVSGKKPFPSLKEFNKGVDDRYWLDASKMIDRTWDQLRTIGMTKDQFERSIPQADQFDSGEDYYNAVLDISERARKAGVAEAASLVSSGLMEKYSAAPKSKKEVTPLEKETQGKEEGVLAPQGEAAPQAKPAQEPKPLLLGQSQDFFKPPALRKLPPEQLGSLAKSLGTEATVPAISRRAKERFAEKQREILATQPPKTAEVHIQSQEQAAPSHALGIVAPGSVPFQKLISSISGSVENIASWAREMWRGFSVKAVPKITDADRASGENAARLVAAPLVGRAKGIEFARKVLEETALDDYKFGVAAVEDNLRGLRDERNAEAVRMEQQGKTEEAASLREAASDVNSIVGAKHSPFKTESEYQAYINRPDVQAAAAMHRQLWSEQKDPLYRQANDLDPETPLSTRGRQLGVRINLKAVMPGETAVRPVGGSSKTLRQLATLKRRDPFAQRAKGTAQQYEGSYTEMMANGFGRELPVAAQHNFIRSLIDSGNAKISDRMYAPDLKIKYEPTVGYLIRLNPWRGKFLQVRRSLAHEYEAVSGLDKSLDIPILKPFNNFMTRQSVQGLAEGTTHMGNLMTQVFTGLGPTSNPILNAVIKSLGRADLIWQVPRVFIKAMTDQTPHMLELAEMAATKEPYRGQVSKVILNPIDKSVRVISDDIYKGMAEKGWVEDSETARREYVNQVGNYHKQLQPVLMRRLRETGLNPFITAGQTFNVMGLRRMMLAPGVKATSNAAALALRADILGAWVGFVTLVSGINLLTSGKADGPKGTPLGSVGWTDEDGKVHYFNLGRWLGYERGPRATGILPAVEAKRSGLSTKQQIESAAGAQGSTGLSYLMGPGARFLWISMFGTRPTQPNVQEAPKVPPTDSMNPLKTQLAANIKQALIEANPIINSIVDLRSGKGLSDIAQKQASRYSPRQGRTEEYYSKLPKIVDRKQLVEYGEDVARSARKLPLSQRMGYVNKRFTDDGLEFKYRQDAMNEVRRHGVFTHQ